MKSLIEEKIHMLSKIKPDKEWKEDTKRNISGEKKVLYMPLLRNGAVLVGSIVFVIFIGFLGFPLLSPTENFQGEETQTEEKEIKESFVALEESLYQIQKSVLGGLVENGAGELTDKEIIDYHISKIEEKEEEVSLEESEEKGKKVKEIKKALEEENIGEAFKIIIDFLAEEN